MWGLLLWRVLKPKLHFWPFPLEGGTQQQCVFSTASACCEVWKNHVFVAIIRPYQKYNPTQIKQGPVGWPYCLPGFVFHTGAQNDSKYKVWSSDQNIIVSAFLSVIRATVFHHTCRFFLYFYLSIISMAALSYLEYLSRMYHNNYVCQLRRLLHLWAEMNIKCSHWRPPSTAASENTQYQDTNRRGVRGRKRREFNMHHQDKKRAYVTHSQENFEWKSLVTVLFPSFSHLMFVCLKHNSQYQEGHWFC